MGRDEGPGPIAADHSAGSTTEKSSGTKDFLNDNGRNKSSGEPAAKSDDGERQQTAASHSARADENKIASEKPSDMLKQHAATNPSQEITQLLLAARHASPTRSREVKALLPSC
jgi:hypothetical protein